MYLFNLLDVLILYRIMGIGTGEGREVEYRSEEEIVGLDSFNIRQMDSFIESWGLEIEPKRNE